MHERRSPTADYEFLSDRGGNKYHGLTIASGPVSLSLDISDGTR